MSEIKNMKVGVSILTLDKFEAVEQVLQDILPINRPREIVITCNSVIPKSQIVKFYEYDKDIRIVEFGQNIGYVKAHNNAFSFIRSDVFVVMNDDIRVLDKNWANIVVEPFVDDDVVLSGPRLAGRKIRADGWPMKPGSGNDYVEGSFLVVRTSWALAHGLFSEDFSPLYFEDTDLAMRVKEDGKKIVLVNVPYTHEGKATVKDMDWKQIATEHHRLFMYKWKHMLKS